MYQLLIRLMFLAAITKLGISVWDVSNCSSKSCARKIDQATQEVLHIEWKPISVFPEEVERFK